MPTPADRPTTSVFAPGLFAERAAVVTGGGTGIGKAVAHMFLDLGARVAILGRRAEVLQAAARELDPAGERVLTLVADIREPAAVEAAVGRAALAFGRIDVLVNNAGGQFPGPAAAISPRGFEAVIRNNLLGTFNVTREVALRGMQEQGGAIVNVIANIERGFPGMIHTGAARAGVENLTRTLAVEWMSQRIRVNAVAPGTIRTEGLEQYPPDAVEFIRQGTPIKRLGTPQEVAWAIVFLASPAASYITGATLYVDGAQRLWGAPWPIPDTPDGY